MGSDQQQEGEVQQVEEGEGQGEGEEVYRAESNLQDRGQCLKMFESISLKSFNGSGRMKMKWR